VGARRNPTIHDDDLSLKGCVGISNAAPSIPSPATGHLHLQDHQPLIPEDYAVSDEELRWALGISSAPQAQQNDLQQLQQQSQQQQQQQQQTQQQQHYQQHHLERTAMHLASTNPSTIDLTPQHGAAPLQLHQPFSAQEIDSFVDERRRFSLSYGIMPEAFSQPVPSAPQNVGGESSSFLPSPLPLQQHPQQQQQHHHHQHQSYVNSLPTYGINDSLPNFVQMGQISSELGSSRVSDRYITMQNTASNDFPQEIAEGQSLAAQYFIQQQQQQRQHVLQQQHVHHEEQHELSALPDSEVLHAMGNMNWYQQQVPDGSERSDLGLGPHFYQS
jgi:hypothetical protein